MENEVIKEMLQALRDGVAGAEDKIAQALPVLAEQVQHRALVLSILPGICMLVFIGLALVSWREMGKAEANEDRAICLGATIAMLAFALISGGVLSTHLASAVSPHLTLLEMVK